MNAEDVRLAVLSDHEELREQMAKLEQMARLAVDGQELPWGELRGTGEAFLDGLARHMQWEENHLVPALREADSWGEVRCQQLADEHREQRLILESAVHSLRSETRPENLVASDLLHLIDLLRKDMEEEEAVFLDERVLRDDPVAIDATSG